MHISRDSGWTWKLINKLDYSWLRKLAGALSYTEGPSGGKLFHPLSIAFYEEWYYHNDTSSVGCGQECSEDISTGVFDETDQAWSSRIASSLAEMFLILVTVIGNALVLLSVAVKGNSNGLHTWFLVSFSLCDFLVGAFVLPLMLASSLAGYWYLGSFICHVWVSADAVLCSLSSFVLCLVVFDRCVSIVKGSAYLRYRTLKCTALVTSTVWILSLAISSLEYFERRSKVSEYSPCVQSEYAVYLSAGIFYVLLCFTILTYLCTFFAIKSETQKKWKALLNSDDAGIAGRRLKGRYHLDYNKRLLEFSESNSGSEKEDLLTAKEENAVKLDRVVNRSSLNNTDADLTLLELNTIELDRDVVELECEEDGAVTPRKTNAKLDNEVDSSHEYSYDVKKRCFLSQLDMSSHHTDVHQASKLKTMSCPELKINCRGSLEKYPIVGYHGSNDGSTGYVRAPWSSKPRRPNAISSAGFRWNTHSEKVRLRERRGVVILGVILAAFVACRVPYLSAHLLVTRTGIQLDETLWTAFFWIGHANSALNPLIYAIFHRRFYRI